MQLKLETHKRVSLSQFFGMPMIDRKVFHSLNLLRAYVIIDILNVVNFAVRTYAVQEHTNSGNYLWIGSIVSFAINTTCLIILGSVKHKLALKALMVSFGAIIFLFHYEYRLFKFTTEDEIYYEIIYLIPLIVSLGCEFSERISYIFGSAIFGYMIVRISIAKKLYDLAITPHLQAAYTFYIIFIFISMTRKVKRMPTPIDNSLFLDSDEKLQQTIIDHVPAGIFKYDIITKEISPINNEIGKLLSNEAAPQEEPIAIIKDFLQTIEFKLKEESQLLPYGNKMLNIYSECINKSEINETYLVIVTDKTQFEEIAKKKFGISFLTYITHELRSPLNVIESSFNLLKDSLPLSTINIYNACKKGIQSLKYLIKDSLVFCLPGICQN